MYHRARIAVRQISGATRPVGQSLPYRHRQIVNVRHSSSVNGTQQSRWQSVLLLVSATVAAGLVGYKAAGVGVSSSAAGKAAILNEERLPHVKYASLDEMTKVRLIYPEKRATRCCYNTQGNERKLTAILILNRP